MLGWNSTNPAYHSTHFFEFLEVPETQAKITLYQVLQITIRHFKLAWMCNLKVGR
jgi:hypothetical protein